MQQHEHLNNMKSKNNEAQLLLTHFYSNRPICFEL